jgi:hypothetical protein
MIKSAWFDRAVTLHASNMKNLTQLQLANANMSKAQFHAILATK